jgi:hypothetical protein
VEVTHLLLIKSCLVEAPQDGSVHTYIPIIYVKILLLTSIVELNELLEEETNAVHHVCHRKVFVALETL